jgi:outer membrane protein OmpA-like peptidoglycan-associated protein
MTRIHEEQGMCPMHWRLALAMLSLLAGCATPVTTPGPADATAQAAEPPRPGQAPPTVLAGELRWMQALFDGTPVGVTSETDGAMRVTVPMTYAFDTQSSTPKPPLRAVMDKISATLARQPSAKVHVGAPGAAARANAMRNYFGAMGVIALRVVAMAPPPGDIVTMRVVPGPVAIDKLDDSALPPPKGAFPGNRGPAKP